MLKRTRIISCLFLAALLLPIMAHADLRGYVAKEDNSYAYELLETQTVGTNTVEKYRMVSQTWNGMTWWHWLTIITPAEVAHANKALILIDGGDNNQEKPTSNEARMTVLGMVAEKTQSVVAMLNQVPNQPLFDGKSEDEIIAYTYVQHIKEPDKDWPLLFPMVKSAVRAMDTLSAVRKEATGNAVDSFFLTGGSKRGWTTWLSAVADQRVKSIAPFVIDTLNMTPQMEHQLASYGKYSSQIDDYTELGIQDLAKSEAGEALRKLVDPYAYVDDLKLPKMIILGANDPYWAVDAANLYFPGLKGEKSLYYQSNTGHDINPGGIGTVTEFYNCMLTGKAFPEVDWKQKKPESIRVDWNREDGKAILWEAVSDTRDFRESTWTSTDIEGVKSAKVEVEVPASGWKAYYIEVKFPGTYGMPFGSCTKMTVVPDTFPDYAAAAAGEVEKGGSE